MGNSWSRTHLRKNGHGRFGEDGEDGLTSSGSSHVSTVIPSDLLTPQEIAEIFKVPVSWVYSRTRNRKGDRLPHIRLGKYIRFYEDDVRRYLDRQKKFSAGH